MPTDKIGLNEIMKRAQEMQKKLQDIQKQVAVLEVTGQAGGGVVKAVVTGEHELKKLDIDPSLMKEDHKILADLVIASINDANDKIKRTLQDKMGGLAAMKLPDDLS